MIGALRALRANRASTTSMALHSSAAESVGHVYPQVLHSNMFPPFSSVEAVMSGQPAHAAVAAWYGLNRGPAHAPVGFGVVVDEVACWVYVYRHVATAFLGGVVPARPLVCRLAGLLSGQAPGLVRWWAVFILGP